MKLPLISVVIRTLNEELYLDELLSVIESQILDDLTYEIVIIDSGSTDNTLQIAELHLCRITYITREEFSFGRSLNLGSEFANGDYLVYISGHCIPQSRHWLQTLVDPLINKTAGYSYGSQLGRDTTKFSECQLFKKYFPDVRAVPQEGFFCNNANSAISRKIWDAYRFDENITGLEDIELAKRYVDAGGLIAYVPMAAVYHIHDESLGNIMSRYERESVALKVILPELNVSWFDMWRYIIVGVASDFKEAYIQRVLVRNFWQIISFRTAQYFGSYRGNRLLKRASDERKEAYYYPKERIRN